MVDWDTMEAEFINNFSFRDVDIRMTKTLQAIKRIMFTPR